LVEITSPSAVRAVMSRYGLSCRKSLGQNFLVDQNIINKIIGAADLKKTDLVVEIGPGLGALTVPAARRAARVLAVEVDRGLQSVLAYPQIKNKPATARTTALRNKTPRCRGASESLWLYGLTQSNSLRQLIKCPLCIQVRLKLETINLICGKLTKG
jgi:hypothetical protein